MWAWKTVVLTILLGLSFEALHPGFYYADDQVVMFVPAYEEIARAWLSGEVPLVSRHSWFCHDLASEYQYSVFSLFHQPLLILSLLLADPSRRAALVSLVYLAVASLGGYRLGHRFRLSPPLAMAAGLCFAFQGYIIRMGARSWICVLASYAWIPWIWLALESGQRKRWHLSLPFYLCLVGGFPQSTIQAALLVGCYLLRDLWQRRWAAAWRCLSATVVGGLLASPALLMLFDLARDSVRPHELNWDLVPHLVDGLGAFLPLFTREVLGGLNNDFSCGLLPALGLMTYAGWRRQLPGPRHLWGLWGLLTLLTFSPSTGSFRYSFRWLALLNPGLAMMGLISLQELLSQPRAQRWIGGLGLTLITLAVLIHGGHLAPQLLLRAVLLQCLLLGLWWLCWSRSANPSLRAGATAAAMAGLLAAPLWLEPHFPFHAYHRPQSRPIPWLEADRLYWSLYGPEDLYREPDSATWNAYLPGNLAMVGQVQTIQGYSPLVAMRCGFLFYWNLLGVSQAESLPWMARGLGEQGVLSRLGVRGLILSDRFPLAAELQRAGWQQVGRLPACSIWHCPPGQPKLPRFVTQSLAVPRRKAVEREETLASWLSQTTSDPFDLEERWDLPGPEERRYGDGECHQLTQERNRLRLQLQPSPGRQGTRYLVALPLPFDRGYKALYRGHSVPTIPLNYGGLGVEIEDAQPGELVVFYRPTSLVVGLALAAVGVLVIMAWVWEAPTSAPDPRESKSQDDIR